jgi:hypothetical protein
LGSMSAMWIYRQPSPELAFSARIRAMAGKRPWWKVVLIAAFFLLILAIWLLNEYAKGTP